MSAVVEVGDDTDVLIINEPDREDIVVLSPGDVETISVPDQGPPGPPGQRGPFGPKGEKGDKGDVGPQGPIGPGGVTTLIVGDTPPASPQVGNLWYESDSGKTFIWYDHGNTAQWVQQSALVGAPGPEGPAGPVGPPGPTGTTDWDDITDKPATFPPSAHVHAIADTTGLQSALDGKAPLASPALTGNPTAPTPAANDNDTSIATTAFVAAAVAARPNVASVSDAAPAAPLDGQLWFESDSGRLFIYFNDGSTSQWVQIRGS